MQTKYRPYLLSRFNVRWTENAVGIDEICHYDYMGAAEYEFGAVGQSVQRLRRFCAEGSLAIYELDAAPRKGWMQGVDKIYALASPLFVEGLEKGAQGLTEGIARAYLSGGCKMPPMLEYDFSGWHDLDYDIFFTPNETFAQLLYSVLSRAPDYSSKIDRELRIGDHVKIATLLNGKTTRSVKNMGIKSGTVASILENTLTVKSYKNYRMPFAFILTRIAEVVKIEK